MNNQTFADPFSTPAPEPLALAVLCPACFDWEHPKPLRINIHKQLIRVGHDRAAVKRALAAYCIPPRYREQFGAGATRIDLHSEPASMVSEKEAAQARQELTSRVERADATRAALPPDHAPLPKEDLAPGRLEFAANCFELPRPIPVQGGMKIGIQTGEGVVTALLPLKVWRQLEQAGSACPPWVAALSGMLERFADREIVFQRPALQIFAMKAQPEAPAEVKVPVGLVIPGREVAPPSVPSPPICN